jgi:hypothetical protein
MYGLGLHSGGRTGMVLQPLPPGSGIHFLSLPSGDLIPAHLSAVADTDYATTLAGGTAQVKTTEHLLSALHACGVTNLLVKLHGEVPVLDGSAIDFCRMLEQIGLQDHGVPRQELVIDRRYEVAGNGEKLLAIEPHDGFAVSYLLRYPPPIGEQRYEFELASFERYKDEIAPARTFGFVRDLKMMAEMGRLGGPAGQLHPGGRGQRGEHRAALPGRVRAPQDPRHRRRPLPAGLPRPRQGHGPAHRPPRQRGVAEADLGRHGRLTFPRSFLGFLFSPVPPARASGT